MDKFKQKLKNSWKSFTVWWNTSGILILETLVFMPELQEWLTVNELFHLWLIGNIIIRLFKTSKAIEDK